jgi:hypothetical protein
MRSCPIVFVLTSSYNLTHHFDILPSLKDP